VRSRATAVGLVAVTLGAVGFAVARAGDTPSRRVVGYGQVRYNGLGPERWAQRYRTERRRRVGLEGRVGVLLRRLAAERRVLLQNPHVVEAINLAAAVYGYGSTLWRKAGCETGGTFDPRSQNSSGASGLFQFLGSTWRSTPFARFSVWSPYANALAAGWMHAEGRGGEWSCR
jgi:hypothetical protein